MATGIWQSPVLATLERGVEAAALRQRVIANNVANLNTPGFKRSEVVFEETLARALDRGASQRVALRRTHPRHLGDPPLLEEVRPLVVRETGTSARADGNNVDLNREMIELAMNGLNYQVLLQRLNGHLGSLRYVVSEGRG